jgi:hypothetical protein
MGALLNQRLQVDKGVVAAGAKVVGRRNLNLMTARVIA